MHFPSDLPCIFKEKDQQGNKAQGASSYDRASGRGNILRPAPPPHVSASLSSSPAALGQRPVVARPAHLLPIRGARDHGLTGARSGKSIPAGAAARSGGARARQSHSPSPPPWFLRQPRGVPPDKEGTTRGVALRLGPSPSQTASRHHLTRRHTHTPGGGGVGGTRAATEHRRGRDRDSISRCGSAALLDRRRVVLTSVISVTGESTARTWRGRRAKRAARRHLAVGRGPVAAHARTRVSRAAAAGSEQP
jgi:hypothetical protein